MSISTLFKLFFSPTQGWQALISKRAPVHRLFLLHVVPFSLIPPLMIYMAGNKGQILFLYLFLKFIMHFCFIKFNFGYNILKYFYNLVTQTDLT